MFKNKNILTKKQEINKGFRKGIYLTLLFTLLVGLTYQFIILPTAKHNARKDAINDITGDSKERKVYVLNKDVGQGCKIDISKDLDFVSKPTNIIPADSISDPSQLKNMSSRIKLTRNLTLTNSMFIKTEDNITSDLRNQDYSHITLSKNLKKDDYIDIRYKKKDGTDYVVAAKKKVIDLNGSMISLNILEDERTYINNATVAADLSGGTLYTTIYVDPVNQEKAAVTYVLNNEVAKIITNNPNAVRKSEEQIISRNSGQATPSTSNNTNTSTATTTDSKPQFIQGGKK